MGMVMSDAPEYGDMAKLDKLRLTDNPATDAQFIKDAMGGRPADTSPEKLAVQMAKQMAQQYWSPQQRAPSIDPEHERMMNTVVYLQSVAEAWIKIASQPDAGPLTKAYATAALRSWRKAFESARGRTPFFQDV